MSITIGTGAWLARRGESIAEAVIEASWLAAVLLVPSFFNPSSGRSFEPDRVLVLVLPVAVGAAAWVAKVAAGGRAAAPLPDGTGGGAWRLLQWAIPAVAVAVSFSTSLSLEPRTSWWGSFARGYGAVTQLALLAFLGLVLAHLRRPEQQRRLLFAVGLGSLPVCLYGLLQAAGRDPIAWDRGGWRVHSSLGNPIFLGAYLAVAVFVTAAWFAAGRDPAGDPRSKPGGLALAAGLYVLALQVAVCLLTQSRGPLVGLVCGAILLVLVSVSALPISRSGRRKALTAAVLLLAIGSIVTATAVSRVGSGNRWLGRLSRVADPGARSTRVRLLIWEGVARAMTHSDGAEAAAGLHDPHATLRPAVGYGPEMMPAATAGFMPAELDGLEVGRRADRAHNEIWDLAATVGLTGTLAWLVLWLAGFEMALAGLGLVPGRQGAWWFRGGVALATVAGGLVPRVISGEWVLSGLGAGAGFLAGIAAGAVVGGLSGRKRQVVPGSGVQLACLTAAMAAHLAEVQLGIAVVSSRLLAFTALSLVPMASRPRTVPAVATPVGPPVFPALSGIASAGIGAVLVFGLARGASGQTDPSEVLRANFVGAPAAPLPAILVIVAVISGLLSSWRGGLRAAGRIAAAQLAAAGVAAVFLIASGARIAAAADRVAASGDPWAAVELASGRLGVLLAAVLALTLAMAAVLAPREAPGANGLPRPWAMAVALPLAGLLFAAVVSPLAREVEADTGFRHAATLAARGRSNEALEVAAEARRLAPRRGWTAVAEARLAAAVAAATSGSTAEDAARRCREAVADAQLLTPWTVAASPVLPPCPGAAVQAGPRPGVH